MHIMCIITHIVFVLNVFVTYVPVLSLLFSVFSRTSRNLHVGYIWMSPKFAWCPHKKNYTCYHNCRFVAFSIVHNRSSFLASLRTIAQTGEIHMHQCHISQPVLHAVTSHHTRYTLCTRYVQCAASMFTRDLLCRHISFINSPQLLVRHNISEILAFCWKSTTSVSLTYMYM